MAEVPDEIVRCVLGEGLARVVAVTSTVVGREAAHRHGAVGVAAVALTRAATAGLLLATLTKDDERVTLQLTGDGPLGAITVDAASSGTVRASVKHATASLAVGLNPGVRVSVGKAVGTSGTVTVIRDLKLKERVSGQTALEDGEVDTDVESYLTQSEQVDSALGCDALLGDDLDILGAAGVLVQALPDSGAGSLIAELRRRLRSGLLAGWIGRTDAGEGLSAEALARAVLPPDGPALRVLDRRPVSFACTCSRSRAAGALTLIEDSDLPPLLDDSGGAVVLCEFCRAAYRFASDEIQALRASAT
jgi:molecular chaperone Hsp33